MQMFDIRHFQAKAKSPMCQKPWQQHITISQGWTDVLFLANEQLGAMLQCSCLWVHI